MTPVAKLIPIVMFLAFVVQPISADEPIVAGAEIEYPPFSVVDASGNADGFAIELLREAITAMGREVVFRTGTWAEVRGWLESGEIDTLPIVGRTPEREQLFDFTFPYMTLHGAIVVRTDTTEFFDLDDLEGRSVAVMKGDNAEEFLRREGRRFNIVTTPTFEDALTELAWGRHDAVVMQRVVALRLIKELKFSNLQVIERPIDAFRQDFCFAVTEDDSETLAILNEGLSVVIANGTYRRLHAKWFAALELPTRRSIIVGGDENYPPFEFVDERGRPQGFNVDIMRAVAREMDLDLEFRLGPWNDILEGAVRGEIDALEGMLYSPERDAIFDFTAPHTVSHQVAVVRNDARFVPSNVEELGELNVVVQKGDIMHDFTVEQGLSRQTTAVQTQEEALRLVAEGSQDVALVSRLTAFYWIRRHGWDDLEVGSKPFASQGYCIAVLEGNDALLASFSEGLKAIKENGEYRRIYEKWMGVYEELTPDFATILTYVALVAGPLLVVLSLSILWSRSLRKQVASRTAELQKSLELQRAMFICSPVALYSCRLDGTVLSWNATAETVFGWTADEVIGVPLKSIPPQCASEGDRLKRLVREGKEIIGIEVVRRKKNGELFNGRLSLAPIRDATGEIVGLMAAMEDISERLESENRQRSLEDQLAQAQRMESVGRLAGGVAHDYNNMLGVIIGYADLAIEKIDSTDPLYDDIEEIRAAAMHSADITSQLLAFARRQTITPVVLNLNQTIESMLNMLRRLIGEDIDISWKPGASLWPVKFDPAQVNQILANLCVNARDAITSSGRIVIETGNTILDNDFVSKHPDAPTGEHVLLKVMDNGRGMDQNTLANAFEPFYSTKGVGKGTGLGLATVYGIVKQNNGYVTATSEQGKGATFTIYLPRSTQPTNRLPPNQQADTPKAQGETVLLVEDESAIMSMARTILEELGYTVHATTRPTEAIAIASVPDRRIDLLITDVVMPEMNGRELSFELAKTHPDLRTLFISGYTTDVIADQGILEDNVHLLQKPFSRARFAAAVREMIDAPETG